MTRKSPAIYIWILILSVAMLVTQNLQIHAHTVDHDPVKNGQHESTLMAVGHEHIDTKHLSLDNSHADHHSAVMFEMDASPDGLSQPLAKKLSAVAVLTLYLIFLFLGRFVLYRLTIRRNGSSLPRRRYHLIPVLRAPPLSNF